MVPAPAPAAYLCPITQRVMREAVVAQDEQTYERAAIEAWVTRHGTSPTTGQVMAAIFIRNIPLQALIDE